MRTLLAQTLGTVELHFWQAMAGTTGMALAWRRRFRTFQPFLVFLSAGAITFILGRLAGQLLLALFD